MRHLGVTSIQDNAARMSLTLRELNLGFAIIGRLEQIVLRPRPRRRPQRSRCCCSEIEAPADAAAGRAPRADRGLVGRRPDGRSGGRHAAAPQPRGLGPEPAVRAFGVCRRRDRAGHRRAGSAAAHRPLRPLLEDGSRARPWRLQRDAVPRKFDRPHLDARPGPTRP